MFLVPFRQKLLKKIGLIWRFWLVGVLGFQFISFGFAESGLKRFTFREPQMGTLMQITLYAEEEEKAEEAAAAGFARIAELNSIFSDYDLESEVMQLVGKPPGEPVKVSDELFSVLSYSQDLSEKTEGAFDVTVGPLSRIWRKVRNAGELPKKEEIAAARRRFGFRFVELDSEEKTVKLGREGMLFDFGGVAKGFAADEALRVLKEFGFSRALVAAAGDIAAGDPPPGEEGWRVGIDVWRREETLVLKNRAVSTSGDREQFIEIDGVRYSHIVDPETGLGLTERIGVTVVAPKGIYADSLATAVSVLGVEKGLELLEFFPEAEVRIFALIDGEIRTIRSGNK